MITVADVAKQTRMVVHGGNDYKDEVAQCFAVGHPILSIEIGGDVRHFKCTSVLIRDTDKQQSIQNGYYQLKNPEAVQLDRTYKALTKPTIPVVDFNHSVYLRNDETPPLLIYPTDNPTIREYQTQFELSEEDKIGVIKKLLELAVEKGNIRKPYVSKDECEQADRDWNQKHGNNPHPIQVVKSEELTLDMSDLNSEMSVKFFNKALE